MERLTFEGNFCDIAQCRELPCKYDGNCTQKEVWERLKQFEDAIGTPEKAAWAKKTIEMAFSDDTSEVERLRELYKADKDRRVVILPCKIGDKLYRVFAGEIFEHRVGSMKYFAIQKQWDIETYPFCPYVESSIGKTIFLTREEAEKALKEMEGKKDGNETSM